MLLTHTLLSYAGLDAYLVFRSGEPWERRIKKERLHGILLGRRSFMYLSGTGALYLFITIIHPLLFRRTQEDGSTAVILPFLPLMAMSVYCAVGLVAYWRQAYYQHVRKQDCISQYCEIESESARLRTNDMHSQSSDADVAQTILSQSFPY